MRLIELVGELLKVSEKAADLARTVRSEEALFELLVEEKKGDEQNKRFVQDFKTLADVLVQETVRNDLGLKFDGLAGRIQGEESNHFMNTLGESVTISVQQNQESTANLLSRVLDGNLKAASLLADVIHKKMPELLDQELERLPDVDVADDSIGIWIDPIDSTAQYIQGQMSGVSESGIHSEGLRCVVVIIGVYRLSDGLPIVGVVNQPFVMQDESSTSWSGRCVWGVSLDSHSITGPLHLPQDEHPELNVCSRSIVMSSSEHDSVKHRLMDQYELVYTAGAGYKILNVMDGLVCAYVLSKGSTFKWDTCAPHAILRSLGGGVVEYSSLLKALGELEGCDNGTVERLVKQHQVRYNHGNDLEGADKWCNVGGVIAYRSVEDLRNVIKCLNKK